MYTIHLQMYFNAFQVLLVVHTGNAGYVRSNGCKTTNEKYVRNQEDDPGLNIVILICY